MEASYDRDGPIGLSLKRKWNSYNWIVEVRSGNFCFSFFYFMWSSVTMQ